MKALFLVLLLYVAYTQIETSLNHFKQHTKLFVYAPRVKGTVESLQKANDTGSNLVTIECPVIRFQDRQGKSMLFLSDDCRWYKPISSKINLLYPPFLNQYHEHQKVTVLVDAEDNAEVLGLIVLVLIPLFHLFFAVVCLFLIYMVLVASREKN